MYFWWTSWYFLSFSLFLTVSSKSCGSQACLLPPSPSTISASSGYKSQASAEPPRTLTGEDWGSNSLGLSPSDPRGFPKDWWEKPGTIAKLHDAIDTPGGERGPARDRRQEGWADTLLVLLLSEEEVKYTAPLGFSRDTPVTDPPSPFRVPWNLGQFSKAHFIFPLELRSV